MLQSSENFKTNLRADYPHTLWESGSFNKYSNQFHEEFEFEYL